VQALDLQRIRQNVRVIPDNIRDGLAACGGLPDAPGLGPNPNRWLQPGPCNAVDIESDPQRFVKRYAFIGAFASGLLLTHEPEGNRARLFAPVRGDPSVTYFDVEDDRGADASFPASFLLDCQVGGDGFCSADHRLGQDREKTLRGIQLPADPMGIAATPDGVAITIAHQTQSTASLLHNDWQTVPELSYFIGGLAPGPTELATIPEPAFVAHLEADPASTFSYQRGFALTYRAAAELDVLRYYPDAGSDPPRPFLVRALAVAVSTNDNGVDSRGVAIVDAERRACEGSCAGQADPELGECLIACAEQIPLRLYMANRTPPSVIVGRVRTVVNRASVDGGEPVVTSAFEEVWFQDTLALNFGPSRVELGQVVTPAGTLEDRVFIVAFDSRSIFVLDPKYDRLDPDIRTGRGPHDIAFDTGIDERGEIYSYLLVGHFTDSYIGAVDLDQRRPLTYGQMVASIGKPTPPRDSN
jgi:DNA-binding beta-propeller fold protein YncE